MKYFFSIYLYILLCTSIVRAQDCTAVLTIETDNELAFVQVNDDNPVQGKTIKLELEPGTYYLVIGEASDRWDAKTFYDTLVITECENILRSYTFFSETFLDTDPQDVYVYNADTLIGHTPLLLPPDIEQVTLKKHGYDEKQIKLNQLEYGESIKLDLINSAADDNFFESSLFYYLSAGLVVFGGITAYYKLEADKKYAEYQITGDQALINETNRFDTISGITFAALQINFGFLIYYFLSD